MSAASLIQALVSGALLGCFYAMMALGFSMVLASSRALNLAHGDLVVLGGYVGYWLWARLGLHPLLALPLAAAALLPLGLLWRWLIERIPDPRELPSLVLTFGLSLLLQNAVRAAGHGEYRLIADASLEASLTLGTLHINRGRALTAAAALLVVVLLWLGLSRTRGGRAIRATSIDRSGAALVGINVDRAVRSAFLVGAGLAGATGVLFATIHYVHPTAGVELTLVAIILTIWAGVGRIGAVLVAGVFIGAIETLTVAWIGPRWRESIVALLLLVSLLIRSGGLARGFGPHGQTAS